MFNMITLTKECVEYFDNCGFDYAICGGLALDLFIDRNFRQHIDIDITVFDKDRSKVAKFLMDRQWEIYTSPRNINSLKLMSSPVDTGILTERCIYAIKPDCSLYKKKEIGMNTFEYKLNGIQQKFDFIDIRFNCEKNGYLVCNTNTSIQRSMEKAILYKSKIPYLSPELVLFFKAFTYLEPAYKVKNQIDFDTIVPLLSCESRSWLFAALKKTFVNGHNWIERI